MNSRMKLTEMIDQRMTREMKKLLILFHVALKNAKIYGLSNEGFMQPMQPLLTLGEILNRLFPSTMNFSSKRNRSIFVVSRPGDLLRVDIKLVPGLTEGRTLHELSPSPAVRG